MQLNDEQLDELRAAFRLTPQETAVLALLFEGLPDNASIAEQIGTTRGAVQAAMQMLYAKTRTQSRHELVLFCVEVLLDAQVALKTYSLDQARRAILADAVQAIRTARQSARSAGGPPSADQSNAD